MKRHQLPAVLIRPSIGLSLILSLCSCTPLGQSGSAVTSHRTQTRDQKIWTDITEIKAALDAFAMRNGGNYPDSLDPLVAQDANGQRYLNAERIPRDPWDREYVYLRGRFVNVLTYGRDGCPGGTGEDADIDIQTIVAGR